MKVLFKLIKGENNGHPDFTFTVTVGNWNIPFLPQKDDYIDLLPFISEENISYHLPTSGFTIENAKYAVGIITSKYLNVTSLTWSMIGNDIVCVIYLWFSDRVKNIP